jgi:hypothetical protein
MKYTVLIIGFSIGALLTGQTVWFHNALLVGTLNKETDPDEYWGEIRIQDASRQQPETVTLTARRFDGHLFQSARYTIAPGETQLVRVEDPEISIDSAGGFIVLNQLRSALS